VESIIGSKSVGWFIQSNEDYTVHPRSFDPLSSFVPLSNSFEVGRQSSVVCSGETNPRPVSVITLSSDSDDDGPPPRVAPPHPQNVAHRSNIKRERVSIDHRNQFCLSGRVNDGR